MLIATGRVLRDIKAVVQYPLWRMSKQTPPDNHLYKINRIKRIGKQFGCQTLIETGTFYGQTVYAARPNFERVMSVEVYEPLYEYNRRQFAGAGNVSLFLGDSAARLPDMIKQATGRILYWLDGHYSGTGTGMGKDECPIFDELAQMKRLNRKTDCILIDDRSLFGINPAYPSLQAVEEAIKSLNPDYTIVFDQDCIVALPPTNC